MAGQTTGFDDDSVVCELEMAATPERVFEALTDPKQLFTWWGREPLLELRSFEMDPRPVGWWRFRCAPIPVADHGAIEEQRRKNAAQEFEAHGEVLEYDPPKLFVWSWQANWHKNPDHVTVVRWDVIRTKHGSLVRVTHSGLANEPLLRKDYGGGWYGMLALPRGLVSDTGGR